MHPICVQTIHVHDLQEAIAFYTGALGYDVKATYGPCIAQLRTNATTLILEAVAADGALAEPRNVLAFQTTDIQASMQAVRAGGGTLLNDEPERCPVGVVVHFRDPSGVVQTLLQFDAPA